MIGTEPDSLPGWNHSRILTWSLGSKTFGRMTKILVAFVALVAAAAALPSAASAAKSTTYYGSSGPCTSCIAPFQAAIVTVRGDRVTSAAWFVQPFYAAQGTWAGDVFPGPPAYKSYRNVSISRRGTFNLKTNFQSGNPPSACLLGTLRRGKLSLASNDSSCDRTGLSLGEDPTLSVSKQAPPRGSQTFTGSATAYQDQNGGQAPPGPPTGPAGTLNLTLNGGTISGTGTFGPVDPMTGLSTGGPAVKVTYAPTPLLNSRAGMFQLSASVAGYDICGAIAGSGAVTGLVSCQQTNYNPSTFTLSG
jgi:hypothetical protein